MSVSSGFGVFWVLGWRFRFWFCGAAGYFVGLGVFVLVDLVYSFGVWLTFRVDLGFGCFEVLIALVGFCVLGLALRFVFGVVVFGFGFSWFGGLWIACTSVLGLTVCAFSVGCLFYVCFELCCL